MSALSIAIQLAAQGTGNVTSALGSVANSANGMTDAIQQAQQQTDRLRQELEQARASGASMQEIAQRTEDLDNHLNSAAGRAAQLQQRLSSLRDTGAAMAAAGAGGLMLANSLIEVAEGGNQVEQRLESILKQQKRLEDLGSINDAIGDIAERGHFDDDDELRDATVKMMSFSVETQHTAEMLEWAARQARTMGTEVGSVSEALAKAYSTGNVSALKKSGVVISPEDIARVKEAYAISQQMGQAKFMEVVGPGIVNNTVALADSLTKAQAAANDAARAMDDLQTAMGTGAQNAKANVDNLWASVLGVAGANTQVAETAGGLLYVGSLFSTVAGSALGLGAQVGMLTLAFPTLGTTATTALTAVAARATAARIAVQGLLTGISGAVIGGVALGAAIFEATRDDSITEGIGEQLSKPGENLSRFGNRMKQWALQDDPFQHDHQVNGETAEAMSKKLFDKMRAKKDKPARPSLPTPSTPSTSASDEDEDATSTPSSVPSLPTASPAAAKPPTPIAAAPSSRLMDDLTKMLSKQVSSKAASSKGKGAGVADLDLFSPSPASTSSPASNPVADAFAWLKRGGSIFDLDKASKSQDAASTSGESVSRETRIQVKPEMRSFEQGGRVFVEILPSITELPPSPLERELRKLGR